MGMVTLVGPPMVGAEVAAEGAIFLESGEEFAIDDLLKELPEGRSLSNGEFVCTTIPVGGVQCETADLGAGFILDDGKSSAWGIRPPRPR